MTRVWSRRGPLHKSKARDAVNHRIAYGAIVRPNTCSRCGSKPPRASDGRSLIQAHHHDYSKPLEVEWICNRCHIAENDQFGEKNPNAKLTEADVRWIRESKIPAKELAVRFGVAEGSIYSIRNRTTWSKTA